MQINKHYVLGLALSFALVACGKEEKTKTVTVENPKTQEELKTAKAERDELKKQLAGMPDVDALKTDLDTAKAKVEELNGSIETKDKEIEAVKAELVEAKKSDSEKVKTLEAKLAKLEGEKKQLADDLSKVTEERTKLTAVVALAQGEEVVYQSILDYVIEKCLADATTCPKTREAIGASLEKDLADVKASLDNFPTIEEGLSKVVLEKAAALAKASAELTKLNENRKGKYDELKASVDKGVTLSAEDQQTFDTLAAYFTAVEAEAVEKKKKAGIEKAVEGLTKEIADFDAKLVVAEGELQVKSKTLLALVDAGKAKTEEAIKLVEAIEALDKTIADLKVSKNEKVAGLKEQNEKLTASVKKLEALAAVTAEKLKAFNDTAVSDAADAEKTAEEALDVSLEALHAAQKTNQDEINLQADLNKMLDLYNSKLKPAKA